MPAMLRTGLLLLALPLFSVSPCAADENPFAAHNAYPWRLYTKDRFDKALASGLKHLEVDITYDPKREAVVATHDSQPAGNEPELKALLAPLWTKWEAAGDDGYTLILDFKSSSEPLARGVQEMLSEHADALSKLAKGTDEFRPGKITVCLTGSGAAHEMYDQLIPSGGDYLAFSDATGIGGWQADAAGFVPAEPAGFVRFVTLEKQSFMDEPRARGNDHVSLDRLTAAVKAANERGYRIRVYTINPTRRGDAWDTHYWDQCVKAGMHMIATDAYDVARDYWQEHAKKAAGAQN